MARKLRDSAGASASGTSTRETRQGGRRTRERGGTRARLPLRRGSARTSTASPRDDASAARGHPDQQRRRGQRPPLPGDSRRPIEATFAINTLSLFWVTKALLPQMIEQRRGAHRDDRLGVGAGGVAKLADYAASNGRDGLRRIAARRARQIAPSIRTTVVCRTTSTRHVPRRQVAVPVAACRSWTRTGRRAHHRLHPARQAPLLMPPAIHLLPLLRVLPSRLRWIPRSSA